MVPDFFLFLFFFLLDRLIGGSFASRNFVVDLGVKLHRKGHYSVSDTWNKKKKGKESAACLMCASLAGAEIEGL